VLIVPAMVAGWACEPKASNVDSIELWDSTLGIDALTKTLRSCKALSTLSWHANCQGCRLDVATRMRVCDELPAHSTSPQHLSLHTTACCGVEAAMAAGTDSFTAFTVLESLNLGEGLERGWDVESPRPGFHLSLPAHLHRLAIRCFGRVEVLVEKVASFFASVPSLGVVEISDTMYGKIISAR